MIELEDPRSFPPADAASPACRALHDLAQASLAAGAAHVADALDARLDEAIAGLFAARDGAALEALLALAPSVAVHRHLRRILVARAGAAERGNAGLAAVTFAFPVVVVAAARAATVRVPAVLTDTAVLGGLLRDHGALGGSQTFALANALVGAEAIDVAHAPDLLAALALPGAPGRVAPPELPPLAFDVAPGREGVHLRFLVGTALVAPGVEVTRDGAVGRWGMPLASALAAQLGGPDLSLLALPRPARPLLVAVEHGRAAQREVSAQIFASNAVRKLRTTVGEPTAVLSAHRAPTAPGGGELRLSLSSPFDPREAEGFRCTLGPGERVADVATMLVDLLRDCRVTDIRVVPGVHADRDPVTGGPLLFKPETAPQSTPLVLH